MQGVGLGVETVMGLPEARSWSWPQKLLRLSGAAEMRSGFRIQNSRLESNEEEEKHDTNSPRSEKVCDMPLPNEELHLRIEMCLRIPVYLVIHDSV